MGLKSKVSKARVSVKRWKPRRVSLRMRKILPIIVKLQNMERYNVDEIGDMIILVTSRNTHEILTDTEKAYLQSYLAKYGYETSWLSSSV